MATPAGCRSRMGVHALGTTWTQQGPALTGTGEIGAGEFGASVALSANSNTALIGAPDDYGYAGAASVFTRAGATWTQEEKSCTANDESKPEESRFGSSVALSASADAALIGGPDDDGRQGAAWVFALELRLRRSQQGAKLTGGGESGAGGCRFKRRAIHGRRNRAGRCPHATTKERGGSVDLHSLGLDLDTGWIEAHRQQGRPAKITSLSIVLPADGGTA